MKRHFFICPDCGEPTRELVDLRCMACDEDVKESEELDGQIGLVHRASQSDAPVIGHPGSY